MAIDAIIRVSFQTSPEANKAANSALVGHQSNSHGPGPFERVNTAVYSCRGESDNVVHDALRDFVVALGTHREVLDFVSVTATKRQDVPTDWAEDIILAED